MIPTYKFKDSLDLGGGVKAELKDKFWDGNKYIATYAITMSPFRWQIADEFQIESPAYDFVDDINEWLN